MTRGEFCQVNIFSLVLLCLTLCVTIASSEMECEILTGQSAGEFGLSKDARLGIKYREGQDEKKLQVFKCTCGTDDVSIEFRE